MEPQERSSRSLDVRVNTSILRDPRRLTLSAEANMALILLQAYALDNDRDGIIYDYEYTGKGAYQGIQWVADTTIQELKGRGLAEDYQDNGGKGVRVTWLHQSTSYERHETRERNRKKQQDYRDRRKSQDYTATSRDSVTDDGPVSNRGVGEDRTRTGKAKDREGKAEGRSVSSRDPAPAPYSLSGTHWPSAPPKDPPSGLI